VNKTENHISPPKWANRFLKFYCKNEFLEEIQGDVHELFEVRIRSVSEPKAKRMFAWDVFRFFKWSNIKKSSRLNSNFITMTTNNFKVAFRVLWKQKFNTALNVLGMAVGIACFLQIAFFVNQELSFDRFHSKKDRIYRAWVLEDYGEGAVFFNTTTPPIFEETLEQDIPEVETVIQFDGTNQLVGRGTNRLQERISMASPEFFDYFDFTLVKGNVKAPLGQMTDIVITEAYASKYFGSDDPIGQPLAIEYGTEIKEFYVSAVVKNIPNNSGMQFNMMISNTNKDLIYSAGMQKAWMNISPETYVVIKEGMNVADAEAKLPAMIMSYLTGRVEEGQYQIGFQPLTDIHLNPDFPVGYTPVANPQYVYILGAIGLLVMIIACVNYTTLAVGQSLKRAKEVGVRKVVGAGQGSLLWQYMSESILVALVSMGLGLFFTSMTLPIFNELANTELTMPLGIMDIAFYIGLAGGIGLISGIYPALILSRFNVISVLRGAANASKGKHAARKGMVIFQLLLTVFLISSTLIMKQQMNYLQSKDLGFNYNAMVSVPLRPTPESEGMIAAINSAMEKGELMKAIMNANPNVKDMAMGSHVVGTPGWLQLGFRGNDNVFRKFRMLMVDPFYLEAFGIKTTEGRSFDPESGLDKRQSIILNQAAINLFGIKNPIGSKIPGPNFGEHQIIGITNDFNFASLHSAVEPLVIVMNPMPIFQGISDSDSQDSPMTKLVFRYTGNDLTEVSDIVESAWNSVYPNEDLTYNFVDDAMEMQYASEARVNRIVGIATVLSIFIASLGLLALTILVVNTKIKEIGIRKILGASPNTIFILLFKNFSTQLLISVLLSVPITYFLMKNWLNEFAYKIAIGPEMFLVSGGLALLIVLSVIGYHAIRASKANPVNALRAE
jgi:putative ABC transport system permease protein